MSTAYVFFFVLFGGTPWTCLIPILLINDVHWSCSGTAGFPTSVVDGLRARGHKVAVSNTTIGHCTAINQNTANPRRLKAAADRRNGGVASYGALFKQT